MALLIQAALSRERVYRGDQEQPALRLHREPVLHLGHLRRAETD